MEATEASALYMSTFTREQIAEQLEFVKDLEEGKVDLAFKGSRLEAMAFLGGLAKLCGR